MDSLVNDLYLFPAMTGEVPQAETYGQYGVGNIGIGGSVVSPGVISPPSTALRTTESKGNWWD